MHRPLLCSRGVERCIGGAARRIEPTAVCSTAVADREFALLDGLALLLLPVVANIAARMEDGHQEDC